ncbi:NADPH-dependent 7-cyano-7-deazaguanine reductase QueF [Saccharicrinis sp. FJH62]|uniref:NADPH-dependent 7-cyano-7-deazaguanine reductase QueF n=1 Tax=Saccharicrinis sp. FJH62 TaxID=3344657 RepID=UPI0035D4E450
MMKPEEQHLGKESQYPQHYTPDVLVAVPRSENRELYNIKDEKLPFCGVDVWHAYEFSFLLGKGLPVAGMLKIVYACSSKFIVESKSLKLYLNSFNMTRTVAERETAVQNICVTIKRDLERLLKTTVQVTFFDQNASVQPFDFVGYPLLEDMVGIDLTIEEYSENPDILRPHPGITSLKISTHLLRSNCKVTHQPDWGSVYISMEGPTMPDKTTLLKYIVSLRNENHFHEEICEMIYKRLDDIFSPTDLMVCCLYTRRGGLDINPVRAKNQHFRLLNLVQPNKLTERGFRQ